MTLVIPTFIPSASAATGMSSAMLPRRSFSSASATDSGMPNCSAKSVSPSLPPRSNLRSLSAVVES